MFDWITGLMERTGAPGVFLLMLAEQVFLLFPSELILPMAGFTAARGRTSFVLVVLAGTFGSVLGTLGWYYVGRWLGLERIRGFAARHGRWLVLSPTGIDRADAWFKRHGPMVVFLGWTTLGTALWTALLAGAGYVLQGQYGRVAEWVNPASNVILGLIVLGYLWRVVTFKPTQG